MIGDRGDRIPTGLGSMGGLGDIVDILLKEIARLEKRIDALENLK